MAANWWRRATAWLNRRKKGADLPFDPWTALWFGPGYRTQTGAFLNQTTLLGIVAAWACIRNISEDIGKVPLILYRRMQNGSKERASDHPLYRLLHDSPNEFLTAMEFREMQTALLLMRGNCFAYKVRSRIDGELMELLPLSNDYMRVEKTRGGALLYHYTPPDSGETRVFPASDIWHLRGLSFDGTTGVSVLRHHADSAFGAALVMQEHANFIFANRAKPAGVLEHPAALSDSAYSHLKESFKAAISGTNLGDVAILEEGMKYNALTMTPEDIQLIEQRKFSRTEIAAIFRMPPHKIGDLDRATFSNIEHQSLEYVTDTLLPWARRWEQSVSKNLLSPADSDLYAEHLFDSLLRGDTKARYDAYAVGRQWGWLSPNDVRRFENMNPIEEGGDEYLAPVNMVPLDKLGSSALPSAQPSAVGGGEEDD